MVRSICTDNLPTTDDSLTWEGFAAAVTANAEAASCPAEPALNKIQADLAAIGVDMPRTLAQLRQDCPKVEWIWQGFLAKGCRTLLWSAPKAGKTTLMGHLLRALVDNRPLFGREISCRKVLYLSEESETVWTDRLADVDFGDRVLFWPMPFKSLPDLATWGRFMSLVAEMVRQQEIDLVIFDTLSDFLPVDDENAARQIKMALRPTVGLIKAGAAVLFCHHAGKRGGIRGSSAIAGDADILTGLAGVKGRPRRRKLKSIGRLRELPFEVVVELSPDGKMYQVVGQPALTLPDLGDNAVTVEPLADEKLSAAADRLLAALRELSGGVNSWHLRKDVKDRSGITNGKRAAAGFTELEKAGLVEADPKRRQGGYRVRLR